MNRSDGIFSGREQGKRRGKILLPAEENGQKASLLPPFGPVQKNLAAERIR
jgi:hypothetical protein